MRSAGSTSGLRRLTAATNPSGMFAVADREVDPEVVGFDFAARFGGRPLDLLATIARFLGGEEATEPPVAELADAAKRRRRGSAEPDVERFEPVAVRHRRN